MGRSVARIGAWAGWLSLAGIVGYHAAIMILAGQRVSGTSDIAAIRAYYAHPEVGVASVEQFLVVIAVLVFAVALRQTILAAASADSERSDGAMLRLLTGVAVLAVAVEVAIVLVQCSVQAALVTATAAGEPVGGLFRFWDVLYNSGAYGLEATWVLSFGLAMREVSGFGRFMRWFSPLTAVLLFVNIFAVWVGIPDAATLPSALAIAVWLGGASLGLGRVASSVAQASMVPQPA